MSETTMTGRLEVDDVALRFGKHEVLRGVSLTVQPGEIVTVLGHNGAGKTSLLRSISGQVRKASGSITLGGSPIAGSAARRMTAGVSFTPSEHPVFRELSILANLELGAYTCRDRAVRQSRLERVHEMFPMLQERGREPAGNLSGGQARLLSVGIALMSAPQVMLLDEPSLGISPKLVGDLFATFRRLADEHGLSILVVEQNVKAALAIADRAYFLRHGEMVHEESAAEARQRDSWWDLF